MPVLQNVTCDSLIYIYMYIYTVQDVSNCPAVIKVVNLKYSEDQAVTSS